MGDNDRTTSPGMPVTLLDRIVDGAKKSSFLGLLLVITLAAELLTIVLNIVNGYTWWGENPEKLFIVGVVDAFFVSVIALPVIILIIHRLKQAEQDAASNAAYLDNILRGSTDMAIAATDTDFRVVLFNPAAENIFGYNAAEVMGRDIRRIHQDKDIEPERFSAAMDALKREGEYSFTLELGEGEGRRFIESRISGIMGEDGALAGYVMMSRDVTERRKAENALRESEQKFRTLVEQSLFGVAIIQDGRYAYVNPRHAEMLGYTQEEMMSLESVLDRVHPDDIELVRENIRKRTSGEVRDIRYRFRFIKKDGETLHAEVHGSTAEYGGRPAVLSSVLDISDRIRFEQEIKALNEDLERRVEERTAELKYSESRYRMLMEQASDAIGILAPDGSISRVNKRVCEMLGYDEEEILTLRLEEIFISEDLPSVMADLETIRSGGTVVNERTVRRRDGTTLEVEISAKMLDDGSVLALGRDITSRKDAERALRESEHSYRTLAQNLPGIVYRVFMREKNRMQCFNDMQEPLTGYSMQDLKPGACCVIDPLILPEDRDRVIETIKGAVDKDEPFLVEYRLRHRDGDIRSMQERGRPVRGPDGRPLYIDGVILDVTELKTAQEEREAVMARLGESQKMEAVGNLAGGIAHDFNNLLTVIRGDNELARKLVGDDSPARQCLEHVEVASGKASELIKKLLIFSRRKPMARMPLDLNATVDDIMGMLGRVIGDNIVVETGLAPDIWKIQADKSGIEQVVMNLVLNARDAMPDGGRLEIATSNAEFSEETCREIDNARPGRYVRLTVSDTGSGMEEETLRHIFEPFFSTKGKGRGTGLGLSVVYGVVSEHGGFINVSSRPGEGSSFDVYIEAAG